MPPLTDFQQGNRFLVQRKYAEAIELFLRHAQAHPHERAPAYVQAAECYLRSNVLSRPIPVTRGIQLVSQGDRRSAEYYFRLALETDPANFGALRGLAGLLPDSSDERFSLLEKAASSQPNYLVLIDLGDFHRTHRKDFPRAYEAYFRACELCPRDETAYRRLSDICRHLDREVEAAAWVEKWRQVKSTKHRVDGKKS